jgi:hypothetical protein
MFIIEFFEKISEIFGVSLSLFVWTHRMILGTFVRLSFCLSAGISAVPCRIYFLEISHCGLLWKSVEKNPYLVKIKKMVSGYCTSVHSVCLSTNISAAPTERIYVKSYIRGLLWKHVQGFKIWLQAGKNSGKLIWRPRYILFLPAMWNRHKSAIFEWNSIRLLR